MMMQIRRNHKPLLKAIDGFRHGDVSVWSLEWDTLMYYFGDLCYDYAHEELINRWHSEEEVQELIDTPKWIELYEEYLNMYLND